MPDWKIAATLFVSASFLSAAPDPPVPKKTLDFTAGDSLPKNRSHDWTLGPTGARGWMQISGNDAMGTSATSRQILITDVDRGSPADGALKRGDVITGLNGKPFTSDARISLAKEISRVESADGKLEIVRFRDGKSDEVVISLPTWPAYSDTAPYNCPKSSAILKAGADALVKRGLERPAIDSHINALALLATGNEAYQDAIQQHAHRTIKDPLSAEIGLACWHFSFANIFLSEYYLITGDEKVLPEITRLSGHLVKGQGPLGTWGHTFVNPETDRLRGYGAVNAVGLPVAISLVLARECGIELDGLDEAIVQSANFFQRHVGLGAIPYGDGPANLQYGHDDNGKNSAAAVFFNLLGDRPATEFYTRCAIASYGPDREQGHTGNFFNMLWSIPAVSLAGPEATGAWMEKFSWYLDFARDPELEYPYQGYPRQRRGAAYASWDCPGAYLLHYAAPLKKLRILGRDQAVDLAYSREQAESIVADGSLNYRKASLDFLKEKLASWSPIVRHEAARELRRRKANPKTEVTLAAANPLDRIAALRTSTDFEACAKMLQDPDLRVRVSAINRLAGLNKERAAAAIFKHLADHPEPDPVLTQTFGNRFFPLGASAAAVGKFLNGPKDRESTIKAINRLLDDEDALVSSRIAMGLKYLPSEELNPLLPIMVKGSQKTPVGNVMFANKLQVSCAEVLTHFKYQEGLEAATSLLVKKAWGRNARFPQAAKLILEYKGHAKASLPTLRKSLREDYGPKPSKWKTLLEETIAVIESFPEPKGELKSVADVAK
ncbi:MAG: DUF6288 domain-containing protein [Verrucomicrobiota bacterium JB023]|nr:DUF6288 domain-containing protein [Verrucomicrobiota bacterium JB023]